jgi:hypothetical protein
MARMGAGKCMNAAEHHPFAWRPRGGCGASDHSNGDRDYTPHGQRGPRYVPNLAGTPEGEAASVESLKHWHDTPLGALRQEWL